MERAASFQRRPVARIDGRSSERPRWSSRRCLLEDKPARPGDVRRLSGGGKVTRKGLDGRGHWTRFGHRKLTGGASPQRWWLGASDQVGPRAPGIMAGGFALLGTR